MCICLILWNSHLTENLIFYLATLFVHSWKIAIHFWNPMVCYMPFQDPITYILRRVDWVIPIKMSVTQGAEVAIFLFQCRGVSGLWACWASASCKCTKPYSQLQDHLWCCSCTMVGKKSYQRLVFPEIPLFLLNDNCFAMQIMALESHQTGK